MRSSDEDGLYCKVTGFVAESIFTTAMIPDLWPESLEWTCPGMPTSQVTEMYGSSWTEGHANVSIHLRWAGCRPEDVIATPIPAGEAISARRKEIATSLRSSQ